MTELPIVVVVGSPNAGKSTLVNRLSGTRTTVVHETPGVTRDRKEIEVEWTGHRLLLVDTGGYDTTEDAPFAGHIREQVEQAIAAADVVLFVVDGRAGPLADDYDIADVLRRADVPRSSWSPTRSTTRRARRRRPEIYELGLGEPLLVSAVHGLGTGELLDRLVEVTGAVPRRRRGRAGGRAGRDAGGHRRPPQRRQVVAVQRHRRRDAHHRQRDRRHHARRHRQRRRDRRRPLPLHRHGRHAQGRQGERRRVLLVPAQRAEPGPRARGRHRRRRHHALRRARPLHLHRGDAPQLRHGDRREQVRHRRAGPRGDRRHRPAQAAPAAAGDRRLRGDAPRRQGAARDGRRARRALHGAHLDAASSTARSPSSPPTGRCRRSTASVSRCTTSPSSARRRRASPSRSTTGRWSRATSASSSRTACGRSFGLDGVPLVIDFKGKSDRRPGRSASRPVRARLPRRVDPVRSRRRQAVLRRRRAPARLRQRGHHQRLPRARQEGGRRGARLRHAQGVHPGGASPRRSSTPGSRSSSPPRRWSATSTRSSSRAGAARASPPAPPWCSRWCRWPSSSSSSVWIVLLLTTRYVSVASLAAAFLVPVLTIAFGEPLPYQIAGVLVAIVVWWAHRGNIRRLLAGEEHRVTLPWTRRARPCDGRQGRGGVSMSVTVIGSGQLGQRLRPPARAPRARRARSSR